MKKEWILVEGGRRAKKARLGEASRARQSNDLELLLNDIGEDTPVSVPKHVLQELLRKSKAAE
jgi:hypothetical protein